MNLTTVLRMAAAILLLSLCGPFPALAQGHMPGAGLPPHECRASFEQCLNHCNALGGTEGTDNTCAARCTARNCTNGAGGGGGAGDGGGGGRGAGAGRGAGLRSCAEVFSGCQAHCASKTGNADCASTACERMHAQCVTTGCWKGPGFSGCGLAKE
jgi:hypothetical protein